tara:strand:- start:2518 stop:2808 length:291 start_codon:yes stop_codon:yes gene_type:complete
VVKNFKKEDFIRNLSKETGFSYNLSKKLINDLIQVIIYNIKKGSLNLKNIGSFKIVRKKERLGRNPKTQKTYLISSRNSVIFTASKKLIINLNKIS